MKPHEHQRSLRRHLRARRWSAEEAAALYRLAIAWREEWRAVRASRHAEIDAQVLPRPRAAVKARKGAAEFAAVVARREFGRFYWNGKLSRQLEGAVGLQRARRRRSPPG